MDKFRVFVYMLMRDASLKQRIPCIMRISIFGAFSAGKKCTLYTGKYGILFLVVNSKKLVSAGYLGYIQARDISKLPKYLSLPALKLITF